MATLRTGIRAFSLVEAFFILTVIGLLAAAVLPGALKQQAHHRYDQVMLNLERIEAAKQELALAKGWNDSHMVSLDRDLIPDYLSPLPTELAGDFTANRVGEPATFRGKPADLWQKSCEGNPDACGL
jgi:type II secretory pathway pseudopilin PulG